MRTCERYKKCQSCLYKLLLALHQTPRVLFSPQRFVTHRCTMARLALLVSACSIVLLVGWLLVGNLGANVGDKPGGLPPRNGGGVSPKSQRNLFKGGLPIKKSMMPKKKQIMKGVNVDRNNIVETVSLEDLEAPPGRLWIPASVAGPIDRNKPEPLFNVLVAYCQLDMASYHEKPWEYAMGTFHYRQSGCLDDQSLVRTYRLSSLMRLVEENPDAFMDPSGFIYHETRCGSTLTANMIASIPSNIVHSETPPPIAILNMCSTPGKCPDGLRERMVRTVFRLMGPVQDGHTHLFFKFQSSKYLPTVEKVWPDTKWIYLFRDPLEVIASNLKGAWRKLGTARNATQVYNLGGPCVRGFKAAPRVQDGRPALPASEQLANACAKQLESLNQVALTQIQEGSPNGLVVEYRQLPEVIAEYVYPNHFGMASTEAEWQEARRWMEPVTHVYSKGMATLQEGAVSKDFEQGMDLQAKEDGSDNIMRTAAASMCENYRVLVEMQRWRKEKEGGTMGTCNMR